MALILDKLLERIGKEASVHVRCRLMDAIMSFAGNEANGKIVKEKLGDIVATIAATAREATTLEVQERAILVLAAMYGPDWGGSGGRAIVVVATAADVFTLLQCHGCRQLYRAAFSPLDVAGTCHPAATAGMP